MIRLSCADNTFRLVQPWESAIELIRLLGIDGGGRLPDGQPVAHPARRRPRRHPGRSAEDRGGSRGARASPLSDLFCIPWTDFERFAPNHPDADERERSRALFRDMLELAVRSERPGMTMLPGIDWPGESHEDSFDRSVEELAGVPSWRGPRGALLDRAASRLGRAGSGGGGAAVPGGRGLELTLDYSHFVYQGYPEEEIEPLAAHARHVHARGAREKRMQAALKDSMIDFERMVDVLLAAGYDGDIGLEYLWIDWERLNECDTVSETILLRDRLRAKLAGEPWRYPASTI